MDIPDENTRKPKEGNFAKEGRNGRKKDIRTAEAGFERIYINLGKAHGFFPPNLIEMVNSLVPGRVNIGRIDLLSSYSLFDVEKSSAQKVVGALKGNEFYGHRIYAELATDKDYSAPKGKKEKAKKKEDAERTKNVTEFPKGPFGKPVQTRPFFLQDKEKLILVQEEKKDKCAVAQTSDYLNIQM